MFFDREDNRKQKQIAYRQQLLKEIQVKKKSFLPQQQFNQQKLENFTLIKNIQQQKQQRLNKKNQYYVDFKQQLQQAKLKKQREKEEKRKKDLEQDAKIQRQNQMLKQRYQNQLKRESKKFQYSPPSPPKQKNYQQNNPFKQQLSFNPTKKEQSDTKDSQFKLFQSNIKQQQKQKQTNFPRLYPNKIQNQSFNYIRQIRRPNKQTYYKQLLQHRRIVQEQTAYISELNRILEKQKYKKKNTQGSIEQLRSLAKLLQEKQQQYQQLNKNVLSPIKFGVKNTEISDVNEDNKWYKFN